MPQYRRGRRLLRPQIDHLDDRCLLSGLTPTPISGFTPAQITAAYGLDAITFRNSSGTTVKGDGSGETIALVEAYHDPNLASDLQIFDQTYNLPDPTLTVKNLGGMQTNTGWSQEESLDVEWAHAIAPGAHILVVESKSQSVQDMLAAVDTARNTPGVVAVSMSWGYNEASNEAIYDSHFTTPAGHLGGYGIPGGITFVAASGDSGPMAGASYPAASPNVLSVGGTALSLNSSGAYGSESAWTDSGGGYSAYEPEPSYQASIQITGKRATPDVAFDADPLTGVPVYVTLSTSRGGSQGTWTTVGGTSLGAPAWAAIIAIADQGRAVAGLGSLDGPTQTLPTLYKLPAADFHTVAAVPSGYGGGFSGFGFGLGGYTTWFYGGLSSQQSSTTSTGANTATGLGSPNGAALTDGLVTSTLTVPVTTVPGSGGGSGGGTNPTPIPTPNPGGPRHHRPHRQTGTTTKGHTHKSGSTTVRKPAAQSSSSHKTTVGHNAAV